MVNASCLLPPEFRTGDHLRIRAVTSGVIEFEIVHPASQVEAYQEWVHALGRHIVSAHKPGQVDDRSVAVLDGYPHPDLGLPKENTLEAALRLLKLAAERGAFKTLSRRDSIIAYLRRRVVRWHEMSKQLAAGEPHVAERFAGAARLTEDAIRDLEVDVDLMPAEVTS